MHLVASQTMAITSFPARHYRPRLRHLGTECPLHVHVSIRVRSLVILVDGPARQLVRA